MAKAMTPSQKIQAAAEAPPPKRRGFLERFLRGTPAASSAKPASAKPVKAPKGRTPLPYIEKAPPSGDWLGDGVDGVVAIKRAAAPSPFVPASPAFSTSGLSVAASAELLEAKDRFSELPDLQDLRALKTLRRRSLPPNAPAFLALKANPPSLTLQISNDHKEDVKGSLATLETPRARPSSIHGGSTQPNTFNLSFPESDTRRRRVSGESTTSSIGGMSFASHRDSGLWAEQWNASNVAITPVSPTGPSPFLAQDNSISDTPIPTFTREAHQAFHAATRNLGMILQLELVYLAAVDLSKLPDIPDLTVLASHGFEKDPTSPLDPKLHLEALRTPERGLLYQRSLASAAKQGHRTGMLVPVREVGNVGYLLCGFTTKVERELNDRDVRYLRSFATELEKWVIKVQL